MVIANDSEIIAASADGHVRFLTLNLDVVGEIVVEASPIAALALSPDGRLVAAAGLKGGIAIIDRASRQITARLVGPGLPVWSLTFNTDNRTLFTGGADRVVRRWDAVQGQPIGSVVPEPSDRVAGDPNERGAVLFRACQACHTVTGDGGNRAGPTLYGVFGRRIATAAGYTYSESLKRLNIVWNAETIAKLFEVGPATYTPGTKMPEQTITDLADRKALVEWLERVTGPR
jgi:cytochrome c